MIKKRLQELCKALHISGRKFGVGIGRSESWVRADSENVGTDVLVNLSTTWPQVNLRWVLTGEGPIFLPNTQHLACEDSPNYGINKDYDLIQELRNDNAELRKENKDLREALLNLMNKNEILLIENTQLKLSK